MLYPLDNLIRLIYLLATRTVHLLVVAGVVWFVLVAFDAVEPPDWASFGGLTRILVDHLKEAWATFWRGYGATPPNV